MEHMVRNCNGVSEKADDMNSKPTETNGKINMNSMERIQSVPKDPQKSASSSLHFTLQGILSELKRKQENKLKMERQADIGEQWRNMAAMYDRILFIVFLFTILVITVWFLTLNPTVESQMQ